MARKTSSETPTDEEILSYNNVPVPVAAKYIGWSACNIAYALQQERAPFGYAVQTGMNAKTGIQTFSYNISPGLLVSYKHGTLETWKLSQLAKVISHEFGTLLDERIGNIMATFFAESAANRRAS